MTLFDIIILALIQGITEFLPISSSGHLALWPLLTGRPDQGVMMDVAVHLGTLVAVCIYFRREVGRLFVGLGHLATGRARTDAARLTILIAVATVPAVLVGLVMKLTGADIVVRNVEVIGWATLLGGFLLWFADRMPERVGEGALGLRSVLAIGMAQALALVPGTSRSGITMTAARAMGFDRVSAARISMLMAVPLIFAAGVLETKEVLETSDLELGTDLVLGAILSCLAALAALTLMMRMFAGSWTMLPFVLYRLALGVVLLGLTYSGALT